MCAPKRNAAGNGVGDLEKKYASLTAATVANTAGNGVGDLCILTHKHCYGHGAIPAEDDIDDP